MQFIQAKHYRAGGNMMVNRVVIHDMEYPKKPDSAEAVARMFATSDRVASAHYCVDNNSIVQCVRDFDTAFHAPPNQHSIGIEHAGYARQSTGDWLDDYGTAMLRDQSAVLARGLCNKHDIPKIWLNVDDLKAGKRGITSHWNVSLAFGQSTHTDPGPNFPVEQYMQWVIGPPPLPPKPEPKDDPVPIPCILTPVDDNGNTHNPDGTPIAPVEWFDVDEWTTLSSMDEVHQLEQAQFPNVKGTPFVRELLKRTRTNHPR